MRPDHLRRTYFPYLTLLVLTCQDLGLPVVFHSDGNLWPTSPKMLKTGVNGIHGLDPASAMSLALARQHGGPHLCLWGNLNLGWLAQPHTDEAILAHLHDRLNPVLASPVILGTCSGLAPGLPLATLDALYRAGRDFPWPNYLEPRVEQGITGL